MTIEQVFQDKTIKAKGKVSTIGEWLINNEMPIDELLAYAEKTKKRLTKQLALRAVEYATKKVPTIADENLLSFCNKSVER
jgi:hypothetical protein